MLIWVILVCLKIRLAVEILTRQWCWSFNWRFLSLCNLFILQKAIDAGLLLTTNEIRAQKDLVFAVTRRTFQLEPLDQTLRGYGISLKMALAWQIRQTRLHQACTSEVLEFNLKIWWKTTCRYGMFKISNDLLHFHDNIFGIIILRRDQSFCNIYRYVYVFAT